MLYFCCKIEISDLSIVICFWSLFDHHETQTSDGEASGVLDGTNDVADPAGIISGMLGSDTVNT